MSKRHEYWIEQQLSDDSWVRVGYKVTDENLIMKELEKIEFYNPTQMFRIIQSTLKVKVLKLNERTS